MIEKHLIDNNKKTVDSFFSLNHKDFKKLVNQIRQNEIAFGKISYKISESSTKNLNGRRSLYVVKKIKKDERITYTNIKSIRPSFGLHPKYLKKVLGKKARKDLNFGDRLKLNDVKFWKNKQSIKKNFS